MSTKTDEILESLKALSLLEASELVKQIEDAFGVSAAASAGVVMAAPGAAAAAGAESAEEKTEFDVVLESFDASAKIKILFLAKMNVEDAQGRFQILLYTEIKLAQFFKLLIYFLFDNFLFILVKRYSQPWYSKTNCIFFIKLATIFKKIIFFIWLLIKIDLK